MIHRLLCLPSARGCSQVVEMPYCYPGRGGTLLLADSWLYGGTVQERFRSKPLWKSLNTFGYVHVFS